MNRKQHISKYNPTKLFKKEKLIMKKLTSILIVVMFLCGMLAMTASAAEAPLVYEYSSGGDTPNTSTVTIDPLPYAIW